MENLSFSSHDQDDFETPRAHIQAFLSNVDTDPAHILSSRQSQSRGVFTRRSFIKTPTKEAKRQHSTDTHRLSTSLPSPGSLITPKTNIEYLLQQDSAKTPLDRRVASARLTRSHSKSLSHQASSTWGQKVSLSPLNYAAAPSEDVGMPMNAAKLTGKRRSFRIPDPPEMHKTPDQSAIHTNVDKSRSPEKQASSSSTVRDGQNESRDEETLLQKNSRKSSSSGGVMTNLEKMSRSLLMEKANKVYDMKSDSSSDESRMGHPILSSTRRSSFRNTTPSKISPLATRISQLRKFSGDTPNKSGHSSNSRLSSPHLVSKKPLSAARDELGDDVEDNDASIDYTQASKMTSLSELPKNAKQSSLNNSPLNWRSIDSRYTPRNSPLRQNSNNNSRVLRSSPSKQYSVDEGRILRSSPSKQNLSDRLSSFSSSKQNSTSKGQNLKSSPSKQHSVGGQSSLRNSPSKQNSEGWARNPSGTKSANRDNEGFATPNVSTSIKRKFSVTSSDSNPSSSTPLKRSKSVHSSTKMHSPRTAAANPLSPSFIPPGKFSPIRPSGEEHGQQFVDQDSMVTDTEEAQSQSESVRSSHSDKGDIPKETNVPFGLDDDDHADKGDEAVESAGIDQDSPGESRLGIEPISVTSKQSHGNKEKIQTASNDLEENDEERPIQSGGMNESDDEFEQRQHHTELGDGDGIQHHSSRPVIDEDDDIDGGGNIASGSKNATQRDDRANQSESDSSASDIEDTVPKEGNELDGEREEILNSSVSKTTPSSSRKNSRVASATPTSNSKSASNTRGSRQSFVYDEESEAELASGYSPLRTPVIDLNKRPQPLSNKEKRSTAKQDIRVIPPTKKKAVPAKRKRAAVPSSFLSRPALKFFAELYSSSKIDKNALDEIEKISEQFMVNTIESVESYCLHAGRKVINEADFVLLMKVQKLINNKEDLYDLIRKYLPMELRCELIPCFPTASNK